MKGTKTNSIETGILPEKISLTIDEAALMLGVGKNFMLDLVKVDGFPAVKFKRKILINKEQLVRWFNNLTANKPNIL